MVVLSRYANPIEWQERRHQGRSVPNYLRRWWLFIPVLAGVIGLLTLTLRDISSPTRDLAIYTIWIVHGLVAARAIAAGANAISREHTGLTWDALVLTGISVREILLGKWLATLHQTAPWILLLGATRLAMLPIFMLSFLNRFAWRMTYSNTAYVPYGATTPYVDWVAWAAVAAVIITVVLTVLEVMTCTALGLAASAITRRGSLALMSAFVVRFTPVVIFAGFTRYEVGNAPSWRLLRFPALGLADSGSAALYQLVLPYTPWTANTHGDALPGLFMVAILLGVILAGSLLAAWWAIQANGALPEERLEIETS